MDIDSLKQAAEIIDKARKDYERQGMRGTEAVYRLRFDKSGRFNLLGY